MASQTPAKITAVPYNELPPELRKYDKPFGFEQHNVQRFIMGIIPHAATFYYLLYLFPFGIVPRMSGFLGLVFATVTGFGVTVGCHRYWSHKTFKAKLPLQILLMLLQSSTYHFTIFKWCRDHRIHHKYTDTDADPHNTNRGFYFTHLGWMYQPKHPTLAEKHEEIHISDLANDPVLRFQAKYYWQLLAVLFIALPLTVCHKIFPEMTLVQLLAWNFTWYCAQLHATCCVNSVAHMIGDKPYDKYITAAEHKWVAFFTIGEGWHNYHHAFPWDYKAAELGYRFNLSTVFIEFFAWIGWAYDLKTVSHKLLADRIKRTGDGSHALYAGHHGKDVTNNSLRESDTDNSTLPWGWGDESLRLDDVAITERIRPSGNQRKNA